MALKPQKMIGKSLVKPTAKKPTVKKPTMKDMERNRPASKNDIKNTKKSGPKSWNNGFTN